MRLVQKNYIPTTKESTFLKVELYYHLGGYNYYTYKQQERGFYISVVPVEKRGYIESFIAFSGYKKLVKPCARYSKKAEAEALSLAEDAQKVLVKAVCEESKLEVMLIE